jgi:hypothetical protein
MDFHIPDVALKDTPGEFSPVSVPVEDVEVGEDVSVVDGLSP